MLSMWVVIIPTFNVLDLTKQMFFGSSNDTWKQNAILTLNSYNSCKM